VGAALQQRTGPAAAWQLLGFFSKKLAGLHTRDLTLPVHAGGKAVHPLHPDHKPLTNAIGGAMDSQAKQTPQLPGRVHK